MTDKNKKDTKIAGKKCSKDEITRIPYNYTKKSGTHVYVSQTCIKDRGLPGKTPVTNKIPYNTTSTFNIDELSKYGYSDIMKKKVSERHNSLQNAINKYGSLNVMKKLNILMILNKNTNPSLANRFQNDRNWIIKLYGKQHYSV